MTKMRSASSGNSSGYRQPEDFGAAEHSYVSKPFDVIECIRYCLSKWIYVLAAAVACALTAGLTCYFVPPIYEATSKLYILESREAGVQPSDLQAGSMLLSDYREVFKTWEFHQLVQQETQLDLNYQQLQNMLSVQTPDDTRLLYITVRHQDVALACELADACARVARLFIEEKLHGMQPTVFSTAMVPCSAAGFGAAVWAVLAFCTGAVLAAAVLVVIFCLDDCVRTENELKAATGLTVLADEQDSAWLLASRLISRKVHCVLITGCVQDQGEYSLSRRLLKALAILHRKTVLICVEHTSDSCADLKRYLDGDCKMDALVQPTGMENAYMLPIRADTEDLPAQLFHPEMEQLMRSLQNDFDAFLIDVAPVDQYADASAFFPFCDGAVLTAVRGKTRLKTLAAQAGLLAEARCEALGVVFVRRPAGRALRTAMAEGAHV